MKLKGCWDVVHQVQPTSPSPHLRPDPMSTPGHNPTGQDMDILSDTRSFSASKDPGPNTRSNQGGFGWYVAPKVAYELGTNQFWKMLDFDKTSRRDFVNWPRVFRKEKGCPLKYLNHLSQVVHKKRCKPASVQPLLVTMLTYHKIMSNVS